MSADKQNLASKIQQVNGLLISKGYTGSLMQDDIDNWLLKKGISIQVSTNYNQDGFIFFGGVSIIKDDTFSIEKVKDDYTDAMAKFGLYAPKIFTDKTLAFYEAAELALSKINPAFKGDRLSVIERNNFIYLIDNLAKIDKIDIWFNLGDWILKSKEHQDEIVYAAKGIYYGINRNCRKIIATNDPTLVEDGMLCLTDSFIEKYKQGSVDEIPEEIKELCK